MNDHLGREGVLASDASCHNKSLYITFEYDSQSRPLNGQKNKIHEGLNHRKTIRSLVSSNLTRQNEDKPFNNVECGLWQQRPSVIGCDETTIDLDLDGWRGRTLIKIVIGA